MTANFFLNNSTTHRDRRLKGGRIVYGLVSFYAACSLGAAINLRIAEALQKVGVDGLIAGACGLLIGAAWNYPVTAFFTWRRSRRERRAPSLAAAYTSTVNVASLRSTGR
jgi:dolichol-phosphate mannosyltransferase